MESRHDTENAERILYNMTPKQLVDFTVLSNFLSLLIDHFTVLCSVTRPLNESEAEVDLASIRTSLLFLCKSCCCNANEFLFT